MKTIAFTISYLVVTLIHFSLAIAIGVLLSMDYQNNFIDLPFPIKVVVACLVLILQTKLFVFVLNKLSTYFGRYDLAEGSNR